MFYSSRLLLSEDEHALIEKTVAGTYQFTLSYRHKVKVTFIGGGASFSTHRPSGFTTNLYRAGGGGAGFSGSIYLNAGTYVYTVGGNMGDSLLKLGNVTYINAGGGKQNTDSDVDAYNFIWLRAAAGGTLFLNSGLEVVSGTITLQSNGNDAENQPSLSLPQYGGQSLYMGYGKGSSTNVSSGSTPPTDDHTDGYVRIEY